MTDFETNEIGIDSSPVEAWKSNGWRKKVKYEPSTNSLQRDDLEGRNDDMPRSGSFAAIFNDGTKDCFAENYKWIEGELYVHDLDEWILCKELSNRKIKYIVKD